MNTESLGVDDAHILLRDESAFHNTWSRRPAALRQVRAAERERPRVALRRGAVPVVPSAGFEPVAGTDLSVPPTSPFGAYVLVICELTCGLYRTQHDIESPRFRTNSAQG